MKPGREAESVAGSAGGGNRNVGTSVKGREIPPTTSSQPIRAKPREALHVNIVVEQNWNNESRGVAEREFSSDAEKEKCKKMATIVRTSRLLCDLLMKDKGHAALFIIADSEALKEEFGEKIDYTNEELFEELFKGKCVSDEEFQRLLPTYTRHQDGDRDEKGRSTDGAFLVSSRKGMIKAACAKIHFRSSLWKIKNSGTRHEALVGFVEHFNEKSKPCIGLLLSEGGSLKILSTRMLRREEAVLQISREGVDPHHHDIILDRQDFDGGREMPDDGHRTVLGDDVYQHRASPPHLTPDEVAAVPRLVLEESCFLGRGGFGSVFKGTVDGEPVAVKRIKERNNKEYRERFATEEERQEHRRKVADEINALMKSISVAHICKIFGAYSAPVRRLTIPLSPVIPSSASSVSCSRTPSVSFFCW
uniref:Protein kinase domain-containing protein n=1 Tax=Chromera velia CCMP2878 TaxID=1169474 RepID=A0A0G4G664_9ALVE|eukprot:Cvel_20467.t1-p1 / transcript=Cvel_20467.t1 / gene=Cvel_20467 / organism=Chromera_velia_CCMP2878 / gene_product=hypothetical protein / transcript_product=hypothetical protein / location=Cvel_scaffold1838:26234-28546(-) / protein_length=419 / sequence_SO=supercontig / SO=protein_coding / is_pseudo=false